MFFFLVNLIIKNRVSELDNQYHKFESELSFNIITIQEILFRFENFDIMVKNNEDIVIDGEICRIGKIDINLNENKFLYSIAQVY